MNRAESAAATFIRAACPAELDSSDM